ncbi:MAG: tyrosine-type recombinase/integrase, partial [Thiomicrorhabdus sp.]|nr:tyrosine-type recombinase/integrase [Thiomicrorhabdus sp.]
WLDDGRYWFLDNHAQSVYRRIGKPFPKKQDIDADAFFIGSRGNRFNTGFYPRLSLLKSRAGIDKQFSLHTLRHSIATHLLSAGMDIEEISRFLGHSSLASTQIYTHLTPI